MTEQVRRLLDMAITAETQEDYQSALRCADQVLRENVAVPAAWIIKGTAYAWQYRHTTCYIGHSIDCWNNAYTYAQPNEKENVARLVEASVSKAAVFHVEDVWEKNKSLLKKYQVHTVLNSLNGFKNSLHGLNVPIRLQAYEAASANLVDHISYLTNWVRRIPYPTDTWGQMVYVLAMTEINVALLMAGSFWSSQYAVNPALLDKLTGCLERLATHINDTKQLSSIRENRRYGGVAAVSSYAQRMAAKAIQQWKPQLVAQAQATYWTEHADEKTNLDQEIEQAENNLNAAKDEQKHLPSEAKYEQLLKIIKDKQNTLEGLSFFKFKDKAALRAELDKHYSEKADLQQTVSKDKQKAEQYVKECLQHLKKLRATLAEPPVTVDDHLEPMLTLKDGRFGLTMAELLDVLDKHMGQEMFISYSKEETKKDTDYASIHELKENNEKGEFLGTIRCELDPSDKTIQKISVSFSCHHVEEKKDKPENMLVVLVIMSKFLCKICPSLGLEESQKYVADALAKTEPIIIDRDGMHINLESRAGFSFGKDTYFVFTPEALASTKENVGLMDLTNVDMPMTVQLLESLCKQALEKQNFEDVQQYSAMLLAREPGNILGLEGKAAGLGWSCRTGDITDQCKEAFLEVLHKAPEEQKQEVFQWVQRDIGMIGKFRMDNVVDVFLHDITKDNAEKVTSTSSNFHQFCFDFEAESGRTLNAGLVLSPAGAQLVKTYQAAYEILKGHSYTEKPTKLEQVEKNNWLNAVVSSLTSAAWISNTDCLVGVSQMRDAFNACSNLESHVKSSFTPCKNAAAVVGYKELGQMKTDALAEVKKLLTTLPMELSEEHKALFSNWNQPFTIKQLAEAVQSLLPDGYVLKEDGLPEAVVNGTIPFRERRFPLSKVEADGTETSCRISLVGESVQDGAPVDAVYVECDFCTTVNPTTATEAVRFATTCAAVLACLCPSADKKEAFERGVNSLCDGYTNEKDYENVHVETVHGIGFIVCPIRMRLTKKPPKTEDK